MRSRPGVRAAVTSALLGLVGCGAPSNEELALQEAGQALSTGPDFVVREVSTAPSAMPGGALPVKVTVCNQGTVGDSVNLEVFLSADRIISTQDTYVAGTFLGWMEPGQCLTESFFTTASVSDGVWYPGALVDSYGSSSESDETNNGRVGTAVGVGIVPDFVVKSVVGPASARPNEPFNVSVTVCNQGTQGAATDGVLVLSQDAVIQFSYTQPPETQDAQLIGFSVGMLEPEQCSTQQLQAWAQPPSEGAWYVGAVIDPAQSQPELIRGNNARASELVGLGMLPDFVVQAVTTPASVLPGQQFSTSVTVCNQGTTPGSTEVQLVLSRDAVIQFSPGAPAETQDLPLTVFPSGMLEPGQCATRALQTSVSPPTEGGWYLGAVADAGQAQQELIESNNTRASKLTGVGFGPDFIVQSVVGPASVRPNYAFDASVTVCNQGTGPGHADVALVLSQDATIRFTPGAPPSGQDTLLFNFSAGPLQPGQCATRQHTVYAQPPTEGGWYLGAVVDPGQAQLELLEGNNTRASKLVGMGHRPDFVIQAVSGPPSLYPGESFDAAVTVCNQGTEAGATEVQVVLSQDTDIRFSYSAPPAGQDPQIGYVYSGHLQPGQCKTEQVSASANVPTDGAWYLGAVADPGNFQQELIESNNARASLEPVGIGQGADFVIREVTVPASATPGQEFEVAVTVCNQGNASGEPEVQLVLSEDATIHYSYTSPPYANDMPMQMLFLGMLEPGRCRTQKVQVFAQPPSEGGWYVGAVLDPWNVYQELLEGNNTGVSKLMGVGSAPDLVVQAVVPPVTVRPGEPFTTAVTVCNQGTQPGAADLRLVLSEDTTIRFVPDAPPYTQDMPVQEFYSGMLQPGQCATQQVEASVSPPNPTGYYLGAVVDPSNSVVELIESNNSRASRLTGIGLGPDLIVQSVTGPASVMPGQSFTATVVVCNQGSASGYASAQLVLSRDATIRFANEGPAYDQDSPLGVPFSVQLGEGQCSTHPVQAEAHPVGEEGTWYLGAVVDPGQSLPELIESNNARAGKVIGIGWGPDFVVQSVVGPASAEPGQTFEVSVTVCNQGTVADSTYVQLVLSEDTDIRYSDSGPEFGQDEPLNYAYVNQLQPGQCITTPVQVAAFPPYDGGWYVGAVANPSSYGPELVRSNNTRASELIGLGMRPDYVIKAVTGPASAQPGQLFDVSVTVCNQGTVAGGTEVQLLLSEDTDIQFSWQGPPEQQDVPLGSVYVGSLEPGQCRTEQALVSATPPQPGAWYLAGMVDPGQFQDELIESNNSLAGKQLGLGDDADFVIQSVTGPASVLPGQPFTARVTVCNQGTTYGATDVQLVLSSDTTILFSPASPPEAQDAPIGGFHSGPLEPGQCKAQEVQASANPQLEGGWYLGAVADPFGQTPELIESNNTRASVLIGVGYRPDFVIQAVTVPASTRPGEPFAASVTVCNQGTVSGATPVQLVLSADTTIRANLGNSQEDMEVTSFGSGLLEAGQCATQQLQPSVFPQQEGTWYLGAVADPNGSQTELIESNNARASKALGVGVRADFIVKTVTGPASARPGEAFNATVTVCNQGTEPGYAEVALVFSQDTDIRFSYGGPANQDVAVDIFSLGQLAAGQCATQQRLMSVSPPREGAWYLGAVVDPGSSELELIENNNSRASAAVGLGLAPDLVISSVKGPASVVMGELYGVVVKVCNQGTVSTNAEVQVVLSEDTDIRFSYNGPWGGQDLPIEFLYVESLAAGQCVEQGVALSQTPPRAGGWYVGAVADPGLFLPELIESNNSRASGVVQFQY